MRCALYDENRLFKRYKSRDRRQKVKELLSTGSIRRRLLDIGLIENTEVECLGRSPAGDPSAF